MTSDLAYLSARAALKLFAARQLSPVDLVTALLDRAEKLSPTINATTAIPREEALRRAHESERRYRSGTARALEGVPVAIKEEMPVVGWKRTIGSLLFEEVPVINHPVVDKLLDAGAIPHLQTTVPEFCLIGRTWSKRFGVTRNPWNPEFTPGGSSGGSCAALAAGLAPLATGSDMGGSIRIPAAMTGVYGFKPPYARVAPLRGEELFSFAADGPLARTLDDLALMQNVISGPHPASYVALPYQALPSSYPDLKGTKLAYSFSTGSRAICPDVKRNMQAALDTLRRVGATVEPADLVWDSTHLGEALKDAIFGLFLNEFLNTIDERDFGKATPYLQAAIQQHRGRHNSVQRAALLAVELHAEMQAKVWGQGCKAFLCPTVFTTAVPADLDSAQTGHIMIDGIAVDAAVGWLGTFPFNLLSRYPTLAVPTGRAATGVPTSMQIVGPSYADDVVFQVGHHYEQAAQLDLYTTAFPSLAGL